MLDTNICIGIYLYTRLPFISFIHVCTHLFYVCSYCISPIFYYYYCLCLFLSVSVSLARMCIRHLSLAYTHAHTHMPGTTGCHHTWQTSYTAESFSEIFNPFRILSKQFDAKPLTLTILLKMPVLLIRPHAKFCGVKNWFSPEYRAINSFGCRDLQMNLEVGFQYADVIRFRFVCTIYVYVYVFVYIQKKPAKMAEKWPLFRGAMAKLGAGVDNELGGSAPHQCR